MKKILISTVTGGILLLLSCGTESKKADKMSSEKQNVEKELYIPKEVFRITENNDYTNNQSDYNYDLMAESDNFALFCIRSTARIPQ